MLKRLLPWLVFCLLQLPQWAAALVLHDGQGSVLAWPAVTVLSDPSHSLDLAGARAQQAQMQRPTTASATLGHRRDAVWLRIPFELAAGSTARWVLEVDYAVLNRLDVHLLDAKGQLVQQASLGNLQPAAWQELPGRSPALLLALEPGQRHELWIRVETLGAMILPVFLHQEAAYVDRALDEQMLQGLLVGLGLCLMVYALTQWLTLREALLIKYALLIGGGILFSVVQWGIGRQYLWGDLQWFELHLAGIGALMASAGTFLFVEEVLRPHARSPYFSPVMKAGALILGAVAWAYALDLIDVHTVSAVIGTLGLAPALMGLPGALRLGRQGDSVGWYFIAAWVGYFVTTAIMVLVIRGVLPANFWTLHAFQFGATLDMILFLRVLALRLHAVHAEALRATRERDRALSMAATDALTGLPNRRGLQQALDQAVPRASSQRMLAVYMMDLDGFKDVNDRHGHEVGDQLLIAVAERMRHSLRAVDLVVRLGGDEFVVLAEGLAQAEQASRLGQDLLAVFETPFRLGALTLQLGTSVGYTLAPLDGDDAMSLLQRADAAMYKAKRSGKGRVQRATD